MDLSDLNFNEGANQGSFMQLVDPRTQVPLTTEEGQKIGITFLGYDSDLARKIRRKMMNDGLNRKRGLKVTAEEVESRSIDQLASLAMSWENITENGEPLEFSKDELIRLLGKYEWIRDQADEFVGDRSNFLGID